MSGSRILDELGNRLAELAAQNPARDIEKNARALFTSAFNRLELVTREEFDLQSEMLAHARERIDALEARVAQLEAGMAGASAGAGSRDPKSAGDASPENDPLSPG